MGAIGSLPARAGIRGSLEAPLQKIPSLPILTALGLSKYPFFDQFLKDHLNSFCKLKQEAFSLWC